MSNNDLCKSHYFKVNHSDQQVIKSKTVCKVSRLQWVKLILYVFVRDSTKTASICLQEESHRWTLNRVGIIKTKDFLRLQAHYSRKMQKNVHFQIKLFCIQAKVKFTVNYFQMSVLKLWRILSRTQKTATTTIWFSIEL
jgi:hypothetical protein